MASETIELTGQAVRQIIADHIQRTRGISVSARAVRVKAAGSDLGVEIDLSETAGPQGSMREQEGS